MVVLTNILRCKINKSLNILASLVIKSIVSFGLLLLKYDKHNEDNLNNICFFFYSRMFKHNYAK